MLDYCHSVMAHQREEQLRPFFLDGPCAASRIAAIEEEQPQLLLALVRHHRVAVIQHAVPGIEHRLVQHLALGCATACTSFSAVIVLSPTSSTLRKASGCAASTPGRLPNCDQRLGDRLAVDARARQRQQQLDDLVMAGRRGLVPGTCRADVRDGP